MILEVDYPKLFAKSMRWVIKEAISIYSSNNYAEGGIHLVLTFFTNYNGVVLPEQVKNAYPEIITIVLQHRFKNLQLYGDIIKVTLSFGGKEEDISIPIKSLVKFSDEIKKFSLDLPKNLEDDDEYSDSQKPASVSDLSTNRKGFTVLVKKDEQKSGVAMNTVNKDKISTSDKDGTERNNIIFLDKFRKKD